MGRKGHCREHILDADTGVLSHKGYNGSGIKESVEAANVPKGSFYNHFASKEAFVVEALERLACERIKIIEPILVFDKASPKQRLLIFFDAEHENYKQNNFTCCYLFGNHCLEMSDENEAIRTATSDIMRHFVKLIANCLSDAQKANEYKPIELAEFIYSAWEGSLMRTKGKQNSHPYKIFRRQIASYFLNP
jgi:TetR/AcrR family transcriptional repressor of nem operon